MTDSKRIKIKSSDQKEFSGYLCIPPTGKGPGLLLIQEIFGVNGHIKDVAQLYAQDGFVVLAPDLFWRSEENVDLDYSDEDFAKGFALYKNLDMNQAIDDLSDALDALKKLPAVTGKTSALGYCLGGQIAYRLAARNKVNAAVSYYGVVIDEALNEAKTLKTPLLMHFAELDEYIPIATIEKITTTLKDNPRVDIKRYASVDHGFNCDRRKNYNRQAAMLAFARSSAFLHKHLD